MNIWTFMDRNADGLFWLTVLVIVLCAVRLGCSSDGSGCSVKFGDSAAVDAGSER